MKKYVIAKSRKDLKNNLKFIKSQYYDRAKKERSSWDFHKKKEYYFNRLKENFSSLKLSETYLFCDMGLYKLFISEIELYYSNNDFGIEELYYIKNYRKKMYERKFNVILPLLISIVASVILTGFINKFFDSFIIKTFIPICKNSWKIFELLWLQKIGFEESKPSLILMLECWALIFLIIAPLIWVSIKVVNVLAAFCFGLNSTEDMAYRYEMDYVENLLGNENELKNYIEKQAENLVVPINIIVSNVMTKEKVDYIDFYNKEVQRKVKDGLLTNPNIKKLSEEKYERGILLAIFYRASLLMNNQLQKIQFDNVKFEFKKNE